MNTWGTPYFVTILIVAIPLIAIVGGIVSGIVRTLGRQRMMELAQRERIAAIERGVDLSKLPAAPAIDDDPEVPYGPGGYERQELRRYQGLLIGGIITLAVGFSLAILVGVLEPDKKSWIVGIVPGSIGLALLLSAWLVRPRSNNGGGRA